jgi:outer membrane protein assembly factor BamB
MGICLGLAGVALALSCLSKEPEKKSQGPELVWLFEPVERGAIISTPLVTPDRVYTAAIQDAGLSTSGAVYCLNRSTGRPVWKFDDDGAMQHMYSSPCLAEGRLYIGEGMHQNFICKLFCLEAESGHKLWDFQVAGHIESSPCVADGRVFFGAGDDGLYCLDAATGVCSWQFQGPFHIDTSPLVVGKRLYCGSGVSRNHKETRMFCLETETGKVLWQKPTQLPVWGSPVMADDQVFYGLGNGRLVEGPRPPEKPAGAVLCVEARSGEQVWNCPVADAVLVKPAVDQDHVYVGSRDGACYCLERNSGGLVWKINLGSPIVTKSAIAGSQLFVITSGGRVCRLDAVTGAVQWTYDVAIQARARPRLFSSPIVIADRQAGDAHYLIYFGADLSNSAQSAAALYCLRD